MIKKKTTLQKSAQNVKHRIQWSTLKMNQFLKAAVRGEDPFNELNIIQKIIYIIVDIPFDFLRRITIPPCHEEMWY